MLTPTNLAWLVSVLTAANIAFGFWGWRYFSGRSRQLTARFRFYALRDRCIRLVASGVIARDDEMLQYYYGHCNALARDAKEVDFRRFARALVEAILSGEDLKGEYRRHLEELARRPREFQDFVRQYYRNVQFCLIDSSTIVQFSQCCRLLGLRPIGRFVEAVVGTWHALPAAREFIRSRRQVISAYDCASHITKGLPPPSHASAAA